MQKATRIHSVNGPHADPAVLLGFIDEPATLSRAEQLHVARHLASGCAPCWSAVDALPSLEPFRPSGCALREALLHLACSESRAVLASDHLAALADARRPPTGFAGLLLAEALAVGLSSSDDVAGRDPVAVDLVRRLLDESGRPFSLELQELSVRNQVDETLVLLQDGRSADADESLTNATALAARRPLDPRLRAALCEAHARRAWNRHDLATAVDGYSQALGCLDEGPERAARRFEIHGEIAILHALRDHRSEMALAEAAARRALEPLRVGPDPVLATGALLRAAELTQRLATLAPPRDAHRTRALRRDVDALLAGADDFDRFTDRLTRACKDSCLARLLLFFDRKQAVDRYRRAAEGFRSCQADDHSSGVMAEAVLVGLAGDLVDDSDFGDSWTPQEIESLQSALARESIWMGVDVCAEPS